MTRPFFLFLKTFDPHNVHNMVIIMLDPCFKSLRIVEIMWAMVEQYFVLLLNMIQK